MKGVFACFVILKPVFWIQRRYLVNEWFDREQHAIHQLCFLKNKKNVYSNLIKKKQTKTNRLCKTISCKISLPLVSFRFCSTCSTRCNTTKNQFLKRCTNYESSFSSLFNRQFTMLMFTLKKSNVNFSDPTVRPANLKTKNFSRSVGSTV